MKQKSVRRRIKLNESLWIDKSRESKNKVLLIPDPHEPFTKEGFFEHCIETYERFDCNKVIFMGDLMDNHYSSFHSTDPDGFGAGEELDRVIFKVQRWHEVFPEATLLYGNHDLLPMRKAFAGGLSGKWLRSFNDVLGVGDGWKFVHEYIFDNVLYVHGMGTMGMNAARKRALEANMSVAIGHIHTEASISWHTDRMKRFWAMICGCGFDEQSYAAAYGKDYPRRMILSCSVVLDDGMLPVCVPMDM